MRLYRGHVIAVVCFIMYCALPVQANGPLFSRTPEQGPNSDFNRVLSRLVGPGVVRGKFIQTKNLTSVSRKLTSSGSFLVSRSDGILWDTQKPFPSVLVVGKQGIMQQGASGKIVRMDGDGNPVFAQFSGAMRAVFSGNSSELFSRFEVYFNSDQDVWWIGLIPRDTTVLQVISRIILCGKDSLDNVDIIEPSGDSVKYAFTHQTFSAGLTDEEKKFFER